MDWHKLTQKQRDLCREAQREERSDIATYLSQLSHLHYEEAPGPLLRIVAGSIRNGVHKKPGNGQQEGLQG